MIPGRIEGATRVLVRSPNWNPETSPPCVDLAILELDHACGMGREMISAWLPTPDEIERIVAGASVLLHVLGRDHPPIALEVGRAPDNGDNPIY